MLVNIVLMIFFLLLARSIYIALRSGEIDMYYGEEFSPNRKTEPVSYYFVLLVIVLVWLWFGYL
jgi:hypothetical protein